ncbi:MAG: ATP-dependent Clp protease ATP-binding subunit [Patescibacteria group bacterium]
MATKPIQPFAFITCPACEHAAEVCPACKNRRAVLWFLGRIFIWDKAIDRWAIAEERIQRLLHRSFNLALILLGVLGIVLVVLRAVDQKLVADVTIAFDFLGQRSGAHMLFALSLLGDLILISRLVKSKQERTLVVPRDSELMKVPAPALSWTDVMASEARFQNVSAAFVEPAQRAIEGAWTLAERMRHADVTPLHLFASLFAFHDTQVVFGRLGIQSAPLSERVTRALAAMPPGNGAPRLGQAATVVLLRAYLEAALEGRPIVDITELLVAVGTDPIVGEILADLAIDEQKLRNVVAWIAINRRLSRSYQRWRGQARYRSKGGMNRAFTAIATPMLDQYSHDLTQLARTGSLVRCIGREREFEEIFRVFESGRANPLLVGLPGVGKTSIVDGLAYRMVADDVPPVLQDKRLVSLSTAALVGAAGRQGELEERFTIILNEIVRSGNIALYIDNIQNLMGLTTEGGSRMDLAEILAQALGHQAFLCIATTNPTDEHRYIERSGLASTLQRVPINEVDTNGAIQILEGKVGAAEFKQGVHFSYDAVERAVTLSQRYIHDRYLPEKAVSLAEEAAVYVRKTRGKGSIITGEDVAAIVAERTSIPVTQVTQAETQKLLHLEEHIHERVIGQDEAVKAVSASLRRARAELRDAKRPIANFLFLGPTGVGKTELAKAVAEVYFGDEQSMIRLDMSEYQVQSSLGRLIGTAEGEGGFLTEAVRKNPFTLLLLDELEKAHPEILNVFLQVMDDGRLTDSTGRTIDFTNVILIATSNAGTPIIQAGITAGESLESIKQRLVTQELAQHFRPEFLNRFDGIIVFKPLDFEQVIAIARLMLAQLAKLLKDKGVTLQVTEPAIVELAQTGFDPQFGARPLRRAIQEHVDNALANALLTGQLARRDIAVLEPGGKIRVEKARAV